MKNKQKNESPFRFTLHEIAWRLVECARHCAAPAVVLVGPKTKKTTPKSRQALGQVKTLPSLLHLSLGPSRSTTRSELEGRTQADTEHRRIGLPCHLRFQTLYLTWSLHLSVLQVQLGGPTLGGTQVDTEHRRTPTRTNRSF